MEEEKKKEKVDIRLEVQNAFIDQNDIFNRVKVKVKTEVTENGKSSS